MIHLCSQGQSRCAVFLRRETKHFRPLSGEYLSGWHSSLVPNDIRITMLQNIYIHKLLRPINSPPDCWAPHRLLPEHRAHSLSASIVNVFAQSWQTVCIFTNVDFFFFLPPVEKQFDPWSHSRLSSSEIKKALKKKGGGKVTSVTVAFADSRSWLWKVSPLNWYGKSKTITFHFALKGNISIFFIHLGTASLKWNNLESVCKF